MSIVYSEPGVFNVIEPWINIMGAYHGLTANDFTPSTAIRNTEVLQGIVKLAQAFTAANACPTNPPYGATILFPGHSVVPAPVGTLTGFSDALGLCSDANGDVWVADAYASTIVEYAHGGTNPIATLSDSNQEPQDCAVDPTTGNLAVVDRDRNVAIYTGAQGAPTYYPTPIQVQPTPYVVTYDNAGNLFVAGHANAAAWLPKGHSSFTKLGLRPHFNRHTGLQWDGQYITIRPDSEPSVTIFRDIVKGTNLKRVHALKLNICCANLYWIQGSSIVVPNQTAIYIFNYPQGGNPTNTINLGGGYGVAVSVASSDSRVHRQKGRGR